LRTHTTNGSAEPGKPDPARPLKVQINLSQPLKLIMIAQLH
jgi:hypothetical protein